MSTFENLWKFMTDLSTVEKLSKEDRAGIRKTMRLLYAEQPLEMKKEMSASIADYVMSEETAKTIPFMFGAVAAEAELLQSVALGISSACFDQAASFFAECVKSVNAKNCWFNPADVSAVFKSMALHGGAIQSLTYSYNQKPHLWCAESIEWFCKTTSSVPRMQLVGAWRSCDRHRLNFLRMKELSAQLHDRLPPRGEMGSILVDADSFHRLFPRTSTKLFPF